MTNAIGRVSSVYQVKRTSHWLPDGRGFSLIFFLSSPLISFDNYRANVVNEQKCKEGPKSGRMRKGEGTAKQTNKQINSEEKKGMEGRTGSKTQDEVTEIWRDVITI